MQHDQNQNLTVFDKNLTEILIFEKMQHTVWHATKMKILVCHMRHWSKSLFIIRATLQNLCPSYAPHLKICIKPMWHIRTCKNVFGVLHKIHDFVCLKYWFLYHVFTTKYPHKCGIWSFWLWSECKTVTTNAWTSNLTTSKLFLGCHIFCLLSRYNFGIVLTHNVRLQAKRSISR